MEKMQRVLTVRRRPHGTLTRNEYLMRMIKIFGEFGVWGFFCGRGNPGRASQWQSRTRRRSRPDFQIGDSRTYAPSAPTSDLGAKNRQRVIKKKRAETNGKNQGDVASSLPHKRVEGGGREIRQGVGGPRRARSGKSDKGNRQQRELKNAEQRVFLVEKKAGAE